MRLGDNNFCNLFQRLVVHSNRDRDCDEWSVAGVRWRRHRHIHWSLVSHQIEIHELAHAGRPKWVLIFVHELWWGADRRRAIRNAHWVHLDSGDRRHVLRWFEDRQRELE